MRNYFFMVKHQSLEEKMLEYVKTILDKVSFDLVLFEKELKKAIRLYLSPQEVYQLREWCFNRYSHSNYFVDVLERVFVFDSAELVFNHH